jgi:hypothetical protein
LIKYKIVVSNSTIEFSTEEEAQTYKSSNNLEQQIESFEDITSTGCPLPSISPRQIRYALVMSGITLASIETAINQLPDPDKSLAFVAWEYATEFRREEELVNSIGVFLNLTPQQIDEMWVFASTL